jgi:alkanesulfonate monooxygenase
VFPSPTLGTRVLLAKDAFMSRTFLWYIPNETEPGHRGDTTAAGWGSLDFSARIAEVGVEHGFSGALVGTSWGRPDTFTVATALATRVPGFHPLCAIRPGYWDPAPFAAAAATLDQLTQGRVLVNVVSGQDNPLQYGDPSVDQPARYARTREFMQLVRRLWTQDDVTFKGEHYWVEHSTLAPKPYGVATGTHPPLYFSGASPASEEVAAAEADVQLMWGEPLAMAAERIDRLKRLSASYDRARPLEFGLRITTLVRETTEEAWRDAEAKLAAWPGSAAQKGGSQQFVAVGQQRLLELAERGEVLDTCLWTAPGRAGGGGAATTWLVGSAEDVTNALEAYAALGVTHFVLSDTPYLREVERVGDLVVSRMQADAPVAAPTH